MMYGVGDLETVSAGWGQLLELSPTNDPDVGSAADGEEHFCKLILYKEIQNSRVRIWDVVILIPNLIFLLFVAVRFNRARLKLRATSSPIFLAFYGLVICNVIISVIRCVVSMTVNAAATVGGNVDKILWVTVRFFLLATEMSVVIFGLAFGHLDSRSSIRRVLLATSFIALAFTITQGTLELVLPDDTFRIPSKDFYVFGHGGMMFWFCSSIVFTTIYIFILILPWTRLRDRLALPTRKSFYVYAGILTTLDLVQSVGAGLLNYTQNPIGLCVVDLTAAIYLTLFTPLVYHTFLSEFFGVSQPSIMFSYKAQVDDAMDEDTVSLPHQQSFSSLKTDSDYIYQVHTPSIHMPLYDSTSSKSSAHKQKASLYSLAPKQDPKSGSSSQSGSHVTLYGTSPGIKNLGRHHSIQKSTPDLGSNPLTKSENLGDPQKSTPNINFNNPAWNARTISRTKYDGPGSISNLILLPKTAGDFEYEGKGNDDSANLLLSSKSSSDREARGLASSIALESDSVILPLTISGLDVRSESRGSCTPPEISMTAPPLESSLRNILDSGTLELKATTEMVPSKKHSKSGSMKGLPKPPDIESPRISSEEESSLARHSSMNKDVEYRGRDSKNKPPVKESAGLGDYLQSLSSPKR
ncbi:transmembrane protein adipocyte-associated 1 homolog isoform X1 [Orussus abietinus]|uniref:transmembrane protein adipocyte-associated 1 homolog isoform X1 n=1 Tax=Orussus abietinus TaxID=222816 RepID=UPI000626C214|nr:transmembrane protein adipocyte-associated 1 homolog isoform X1 [Orussus abietinus]XP_012272882.1 transmembrane protein adipocyte-associated 1 homolog isoform X1 [Orussus abietinus]XP_012272883.1 transmembrane protein adipocyte-associated 1 homolog isoform X1 [Orussus abietinus]